MITLKLGIILDQNDDGPLKWANGPISHSNTCKSHNLNGPFEVSMGPLQNLMGPRILNIFIRAQLT